jgi:two-component system, cell cycle sensor histidine kinase and response regulator CckA
MRNVHKEHKKTIKPYKDLLVISIVAMLVWIFAVYFDAFETFLKWRIYLEAYKLDEVIVVLIILAFAFGIFSWRRWKELRDEIAESESRETEKRLLAQTVASAKDCISITDLNDNILFVNDAFLNTYGYSEEELIGNNVSMVRSPNTVPEVAQQILPATLAGEWHGEMLNRKKDGSDFPIGLWASLVKNDAGEPVAMVGVARDITERKRVEQSLMGSEERFRELFDNAPIGYHELDTEGRIIQVNSTELTMLGYSRGEMMGQHIWKFVGKGEMSRQSVLAKLSGSILPSGRAYERTYRRKDGTIVPVLVEDRIIRDSNNSITGIRTTIQDNTERKLAEEELLKAKERMQMILEGTPHLFFYVQDVKGDINYISPAIEDITGYKVDEWIGQRHWFATDSSLNEEARKRTHENLKGIINYDPILVESKHADGKLILLEVYERPIFKDKQVVGLQGVAHDITERKLAEEMLRKSEEQFRLIMENVADMIAVLDLEGRRLYNNPAYKPILGDPELLRGTDSFQEIHPDDKEKIKRIFRETVQTGIGQRNEYRFVAKNGGIHFIESQGSVIRDENGNVSQVVLVSRDVTEKKALENELRQAQKLESLGTLASGIAHDFNNILAIIMGHSALLSRVIGDPAKLSLSIDAINKATKRGASLVKQLLTFARKTEVLFESVRVNDIIQEIIKLLAETLPKTIMVSTNLKFDLPTITADASQIHQVLLNLCVNARDAMPKGGTLDITTVVFKGSDIKAKFPNALVGEYVLIQVADSGIGMDEATRQRMFEPFFTTKDVGKGTGLGLSVVHSIVANHNGFIDVDSKPDKGTVFRIYLPVQVKKIEIKQTAKKNIQDIPGGTETILVVEDEELLRDIAKSFLSLKGYKVITAADGEEAVAVFSHFKKEISVVISDLGLPKFGGDVVYEKIRALDPNAPIILASGFIDPVVKDKLRKAGAQHFIQKPYQMQEVLEVVRELIDTKQ